MKTLLLIASLLASQVAFAECCVSACEKVVTKIVEKPKYITKTVVVEKQVIVEKPVVVEKQVVVDRPIMIEQQVVVTKVKLIRKKNRLTFLGGVGPSGTIHNSGAGFETKTQALGAVGYQRMLTDTFSVGGQVQTNGSALGSVGMDF